MSQNYVDLSGFTCLNKVVPSVADKTELRVRETVQVGCLGRESTARGRYEEEN
jgi:hypothetical protein